MVTNEFHLLLYVKLDVLWFVQKGLCDVMLKTWQLFVWVCC